MNKKDGSTSISKKGWFIIIFVLFIIAALIDSGGSSSSSYQLHNKDGSLNWKYVNNMWEWQEKQKNK